jgi:threonine/homoserine/homoserine lactone efflux protein
VLVVAHTGDRTNLTGVPHQLIPYLLVVAVLTVTPGPDMALVLRNGVASGSRAAWLTGLGCCTGIAVHATAAVLGLSAILAASALAFTVVKLVGAAYLVYLGIKIILSTRRGGVAEAPPRAATGSPYRQGLLCNLLNPKIALLFLTLLPQFVSAQEPRLTTSAVLAAVFLVIAVLWWSTFAVLVGALGRVLTRARVRRVLDRLTGVVLIGLGVRVAFEHA